MINFLLDGKKIHIKKAADAAVAETSSSKQKQGAKQVLVHCKACKDNSADTPFSEMKGWPSSEPNQCCGCYLICGPFGKLLGWAGFIDLMASSETFRSKVQAAKQKLGDLSGMSTPSLASAAAPQQDHRLQVQQSQGVQIRIFRRGRLLQKKERKFHGETFTAKQLNLHQEVKVKEGSFLAKGHLVSLPSSELEVEVGCCLEVTSSTMLLDEADMHEELAERAVQAAFDQGALGTHRKGAPFREFLRGRCPTISDLAGRADRCEKKKFKRSGTGLADSAKTKNKKKGGDSSSDSSDDKGSASGKSSSPSSSEDEGDAKGAEEKEKPQAVADDATTEPKTPKKKVEGTALTAVVLSPVSGVAHLLARSSSADFTSASFKVVAGSLTLECVGKKPLDVPTAVVDQDILSDDGASTVRSYRTGAAGRKPTEKSKKRAALPPSHWIASLVFWDALNGMIDKRIPLQANNCIDREKKKESGDAEGVKALTAHLKIYTLASSLCHDKVQDETEEDILAALTSMHTFKQKLPIGVCLGIWKKVCNDMLKSFKLSAPKESLAKFCNMIRPYCRKCGGTRDVKADDFQISEPWLCVLMKVWTHSKAAQYFSQYVTDAFCALISTRADFGPLLLFIAEITQLVDGLPDDEDPHDSVFAAMCQSQELACSLSTLISGEVGLQTDFASFDSLAKLADQPSDGPCTMTSRVATAVSENDKLSTKLGQQARIAKALQAHGPTLQKHMTLINKIVDDVENGAKELGAAIQAYEKYSVFFSPDTCLNGFKKLVSSKLLHLAAIAASEEKKLEVQLVTQLQQVLQAAQRAMHTCSDFDEPIASLAARIVALSDLDKTIHLARALQAFEDSGRKEVAMTKLSEGLQAVPKFALSSSDAEKMKQVLGGLWSAECLNYNMLEESYMAAATQALSVVAGWLDKKTQDLVALRCDALKCSRPIEEVMQAPEEGTEGETRRQSSQ